MCNVSYCSRTFGQAGTEDSPTNLRCKNRVDLDPWLTSRNTVKLNFKGFRTPTTRTMYVEYAMRGGAYKIIMANGRHLWVVYSNGWMPCCPRQEWRTSKELLLKWFSADHQLHSLQNLVCPKTLTTSRNTLGNSFHHFVISFMYNCEQNQSIDRTRKSSLAEWIVVLQNTSIRSIKLLLPARERSKQQDGETLDPDK